MLYHFYFHYLHFLSGDVVSICKAFNLAQVSKQNWKSKRETTRSIAVGEGPYLKP